LLIYKNRYDLFDGEFSTTTLLSNEEFEIETDEVKNAIYLILKYVGREYYEKD
jgi:hypothetical protein